MNIQEYINNAIKASRQQTLANSDQLTLGEMILKLEPIIEKQKQRIAEGREEAEVFYDFEYLFPTSIDSWRGSYSELALNFKTEGKPLKVSEFYKMLYEAIGETFEGYKGGEFVMNKHTPVWVANWGNSGSTAVVDIVDGDYRVIIITGLREF